MNKSVEVRLVNNLPRSKLHLLIIQFCRLFFIVCLQLLMANYEALATTEVNIPFAKDFGADRKIVAGTNTIIVLYFSAPDCRYCMKLEEAVLKPMLKSGDYDKQVLLRKIDWRSSAMVDGFTGQRISLYGLAERYAVKVTPTLVFVDSKGREVAPRILGFQSADFFWFYLDRRIEQSRLEILSEP